MMKLVSKNSAPHYQWGQDCDGWHLVSSKDLSVIHERIPPGQGENTHLHEVAEQFFFVLSGKATMTVGDMTGIINERQGCHVPAGVVHSISNLSDEDLEVIVTSTPPSHGDKVLVQTSLQSQMK